MPQSCRTCGSRICLLAAGMPTAAALAASPWPGSMLFMTMCTGAMQVSDEELQQALTAAVTCCILAAAGPQRSRVLANLYKDERTRALPAFPFLEKVYLEHILRREEVSAGMS